MPRARHKDYMQISISPDVRKILEKRSEEIGISMSLYIERLILEKEWTLKYSKEHTNEMKE